ncbi:MAG: hypothetical protein ACRDH8_14505 [Actinomycetota bacterium]
MAVPRELESEGDEFPGLPELGGLVRRAGLEVPDLLLDSSLPVPEGLPVEVAGEVEVEQPLPLRRQPVEPPGHKPGLLGPVALAGDTPPGGAPGEPGGPWEA